MKHVLSALFFCLTALSGFSQPVKYSFDEVPYGSRESVKYVIVQSSEIEDAQGNPKYTITAQIDIKNKKLASSYVYLSESGKPGQLCLSDITHIGHLHLGTPNTGGVEAYACRNKFTNVVFYYLVGANTPDTLKFLFYVPPGPTALQAAN